MMRDVVLLLCNKTLNMAQPWLDAGYIVVMVDPQHPAGVHWEGRVQRIGASIVDCAAVLGEWIRSGRVAFVFGFPPCTDVSLSGTRWWESKRKADRYFQARAAIVAEQCRMVGLLCGAPWGFENPASAFSKIFGKPRHKFQPWQFTGYCPDDNYTKDTWLWTSEDFVMPAPVVLQGMPPPDDRIHKCPPGDERGNIRSETPKGFALAVRLSNGPVLPMQLELAA